MSEAGEGVGIDLTPPSFLQRRQEGEALTPDQIANLPVTKEEMLSLMAQKKDEIAGGLLVDKVPTLEELIAVIKEKVRQRDALDDNIRILNAHAEKMLKALSKPKK